ncbi:receptor-like protein EIX2 [Cornus florida]|uniref:receptor-like protein EIX2 n=1 Tax=Cornus florida TaxID=4283 RepID=UPI0028A28C65|nr:receptor-like protein EIX2 [Cornus florida]
MCAMHWCNGKDESLSIKILWYLLEALIFLAIKISKSCRACFFELIMRNNVTGNIIQQIGQLKILDALDLSRNHLAGGIPMGLARLNYISVLDLSSNDLSGKIPSSTQLQSFDASAFAGNPKRCGFPLPNKCLGDETNLDPSITNCCKDDSIEDNFMTREFYISMVVDLVEFLPLCFLNAHGNMPISSS